MSEIFFTSDLHFDHKNIIKYCKRPYQDVKEMNEAIIENHNRVVKPNDQVYNLGDFCFSKNPSIYSKRLNGKIHLIKGNHDRMKSVEGLFVWVRDTYMLRVGNVSVWLSHFAHRIWPDAHHGAYHGYGHSHNSMPDHGRSCDVGVDGWNYTPVHIDDFIKRLENQSFQTHHDAK